jgi:hypothetical protein
MQGFLSKEKRTMSTNEKVPSDEDTTFKPAPPQEIGFYQVLILFIYHVALALLLAYTAYNVWPPQPWPGDRAKAVSKSNSSNADRAAPTLPNTATAVGGNTNTDSAGATNKNFNSQANANSRTTSNISSVIGTNAEDGTRANANGGGGKNRDATEPPSGPADMVEKTIGSYGDEYPPPFWLFSWKFQPALETRLILLVLLAGAIGSYVHAASSFVDYLGNRTLISSWVWWYLLRPFIGMMLALIFYFVFRGGFITAGVNQGGDAAASFINPFGVAAVAGLVGMFSKVAADKLNEVFQTLFKSSSGQGDANRSDKLDANLTPVISTISPNSGPVTGGTLTLITGTGFMEGARVGFGGVPSPAILIVSSTSLTAVTPAHSAGTVDVELTNTNNQKGILKGGFTYQ